MNILSIFAFSAFKPVQQHMQNVYQCVDLLPQCLDAIYIKDWNQALLVQQEIDLLAKKADLLRQEILIQLSDDLFKPLSCADVLELLSAQYKIALAVKEVVALFMERKLSIPERVQMNYYGFTNACIVVAHKAKAAVDEMDNVFKNPHALKTKLIRQIMLDLVQLERETNQIFSEMRAEMATIEKELPSLEVTYLFKIFEGTEKIADEAQWVGHRLHKLSGL